MSWNDLQGRRRALDPAAKAHVPRISRTFSNPNDNHAERVSSVLAPKGCSWASNCDTMSESMSHGSGSCHIQGTQNPQSSTFTQTYQMSNRARQRIEAKVKRLSLIPCHLLSSSSSCHISALHNGPATYQRYTMASHG